METYLFGDPVWIPSLQSFNSDDIITHAIFGFELKLQYKVRLTHTALVDCCHWLAIA